MPESRQGIGPAGAMLLALAALALGGCATLPNGGRWGEEATLRPGWERVRESAADAARDPWVWAPLLGAALFQIDDWDRRTADWAREHTPVFGSERGAERWSDDLRDASALAHYVTIVLTPGGEAPADWLVATLKGTTVHVAAVSATSNLTRTLKKSTDRERPNGLADESFPSGHTSSAAVHNRLASENLQAMALGRRTRRALDAGLIALTLGTSWSRIEAGWHFPADTLFSMSMGHFIASFINDAFLGLEREDGIALAAVPDGAVLRWHRSF